MASVYDPLRDFLAENSGRMIELSFGQIETVLRRNLPQAAHDHDWWWANEDVKDTRHVQCRSWQNAGWQMVAVNRVTEMVCFARY